MNHEKAPTIIDAVPGPGSPELEKYAPTNADGMSENALNFNNPEDLAKHNALRSSQGLPPKEAPGPPPKVEPTYPEFAGQTGSEDDSDMNARALTPEEIDQLRKDLKLGKYALESQVKVEETN